MANIVTGGGSGQAWDLLTETAYDRQVEYYLRDMPQWRQLIDKRPAKQAMPGDVVVLTLHNAYASLATTPLSELVDPDAVPAPAPTRVSVTLNEYGNASLTTLRLQTLAFTQPESEIAELIGRNMYDSVDSLVKGVADTSTNILYVNGGTMKTTASGGTLNAVIATDYLTRNPATTAVKLLQRAKVDPKQDGKYIAVIHPDVAYDLQAENSATAWVAPHVYGTDTANIYSGSVGDFQGARYVQTTRVTTATNSVPTSVYNTYYFGKQALVEVSAIDPHIVIGPQVDKLKRFYPIGWYGLLGWNLYRPTAMVIAKTASSISTLV